MSGRNEAKGIDQIKIIKGLKDTLQSLVFYPENKGKTWKCLK